MRHPFEHELLRDALKWIRGITEKSRRASAIETTRRIDATMGTAAVLVFAFIDVWKAVKSSKRVEKKGSLYLGIVLSISGTPVDIDLLATAARTDNRRPARAVQGWSK